MTVVSCIEHSTQWILKDQLGFIRWSGKTNITCDNMSLALTQSDALLEFTKVTDRCELALKKLLVTPIVTPSPPSYLLATPSYLITSVASWSKELSMVPSTIQFVIILEVYQVHQYLIAGVADKTSWVPDLAGNFVSYNPALHYPSTLFTLLIGGENGVRTRFRNHLLLGYPGYCRVNQRREREKEGPSDPNFLLYSLHIQ